MAFSDFKTISEVQEKFRITYAEDDFLKVQPSSPSAEFLQDFEFTRKHLNVFASDTSRREAIIFPVLKENYKAYADRYALWIKQSIAYDDILNGIPDYFIATQSELGKTVVGRPLILVVEGKKNDFEQGWGQCLAELVAAQKINDDAAFPVYGVVTDGTLWQFGRLIGDIFTQNRTDFTLANLPILFGAVDFVFKATTQSSPIIDPVSKYPPNWNLLSLQCRERAGWRCEECGIDLSLKLSRKFLHAHHLRGTQYNQLEDLRALCIGCHAEQLGHQMEHLPDYLEFMDKYGATWKQLTRKANNRSFFNGRIPRA